MQITKYKNIVTFVYILIFFILLSCGEKKEEVGDSDTTAPVIAEVTAITTPTKDKTPDYTFSSDESGDINYAGSCSSNTTSAISGNNTITLVSLSKGTYSDCTISVTDTAGNSSNTLTLSTFSVIEQIGGSMQGVKLSLSSVVNILAGTELSGSSDGTGTSANFYYPSEITSDGTNLYIADQNNHKIRQIVISTGDVTTIAGTGSVGSSNGTGTSASFNYPRGITTDGTNLYVVDTENHLIRKIVISTGEVTTLAGTGSTGSSDGIGTFASFDTPHGITTDGTNLYLADSNNHKIRQIIISTGDVTTLAGTGSAGSSNETGNFASFNYPQGITTDGTNLFVADSSNHLIRKIVISTGVVTTLAGTGSAGDLDEIGTSARFYYPYGITSDGTNIYLVGRKNHKIRKIVISSGVVTTIAGTGSVGSSNGAGTYASFNYPRGITTDGRYLYIADTFNHLIRQIK